MLSRFRDNKYSQQSREQETRLDEGELVQMMDTIGKRTMKIIY
jgi:hypothetical protein